jgi:hypothetical protein
VFGDGPPGARVMMRREPPGDQADLAGEPFVGQPVNSCVTRRSKQVSIWKRFI